MPIRGHAAEQIRRVATRLQVSAAVATSSTSTSTSTSTGMGMGLPTDEMAGPDLAGRSRFWPPRKRCVLRFSRGAAIGCSHGRQPVEWSVLNAPEPQTGRHVATRPVFLPPHARNGPLRCRSRTSEPHLPTLRNSIATRVLCS